MGRGRQKPNKDKLIEFSREHLYYEIWMFYGLGGKLSKGVADVYIKNALLEAFLMHARIILDFLYNKTLRDDDAIANDYFNNPSEWESILPPKSKILGKVHERGHKELVHLSYKRLEVNRDTKPWEFYKIMEEIKKLVNLFLDKAKSEKSIDPKIYKLR